MNVWFWVFLGGGLGSVVRFYLSKLLNREEFWVMSLPFGTLLVNVVSCFILGTIIQRQDIQTQSLPLLPLIVIGFCGGMSTFSTFGYELYLYAQKGQLLWGVLYLFISIVMGLCSVYAGTKLS